MARTARRAIAATEGVTYGAAQVREWSASFDATTIEHILASSPAWVFEAEGVAVAFATLVARADGDAELDLLYVDPELAGCGIGRALVEAAEHEATGRGHEALWADASVPAQAMLQRCGFTFVRANPKSLRGAAFDNAWLVKALRG